MRLRHRRGVLFRVRPPDAVFKQAQPVFQRQHPVHSLVQTAFRDAAIPDQRLQILDIRPGHHFDVHSGIHGLPGCLRIVFRGADLEKLLYSAPIGNGHACEAHFLP